MKIIKEKEYEIVKQPNFTKNIFPAFNFTDEQKQYFIK